MIAATLSKVIFSVIFLVLMLSSWLEMKIMPLPSMILCQRGRADLCAAQLICLVSYRSMFLHEIGGIL